MSVKEVLAIPRPGQSTVEENPWSERIRLHPEVAYDLVTLLKHIPASGPPPSNPEFGKSVVVVRRG